MNSEYSIAMSSSSMLLLIIICYSNLLFISNPNLVLANYIPDMCEHESVDSAAQIIFEDNVERYFISNNHYYWLLNLTTDIPNEKTASKIPFDFEPDVALLKDNRQCRSNGYRSLLLMQMKKIPNSNEAEWLTLEMKIGRWNSSNRIFWNDIHKIAHCDLKSEICTTTDTYFTTMSFDFKTKLNAAFGTIGHVAYFIQGEKLFKVVYKNQCVRNPYTEVLAFPGISIGTTTTAAIAMNPQSDNTSIILFDRDVHYQITVMNFEDFNFGTEIVEPSNWKSNNNEFFKLCKNYNGLNLMLQDLISGSKRHYYLRRATLATLVILFLCLILLAIIIFIKQLSDNKHKAKTNSRNEHENGSNDVHQINNTDNLKSSTNVDNNLLTQTTC